MPFKLTSTDKLTKSRRTKSSAVKDSPEFRAVCQRLSAGLKGNEAIEVELPVTKDTPRYARQLWKRFVAIWLRAHNLDEMYDVSAFTLDGKDGKSHFIQIKLKENEPGVSSFKKHARTR